MMKTLHTILLIVALASQAVNAAKIGALFTTLQEKKCVTPYGHDEGAQPVIFYCTNNLVVWTLPQIDEGPVGIKVNLKAESLDLYMTVVEGDNVQLWTLDPSRNQQFIMDSQDRIHLNSDQTKCLALNGTSTDDGNPLAVITCQTPSDDGIDRIGQVWRTTSVVS